MATAPSMQKPRTNESRRHCRRPAVAFLVSVKKLLDEAVRNGVAGRASNESATVALESPLPLFTDISLEFADYRALYEQITE